jgi:hypothetical protein
LGYHHQLQFSSSSSSLQSPPSRTHFHNVESNGYVLSFIFFIVSIVVGSLQAPSVVVVVVVFPPPFCAEIVILVLSATESLLFVLYLGRNVSLCFML